MLHVRLCDLLILTNAINHTDLIAPLLPLSTIPSTWLHNAHICGIWGGGGDYREQLFLKQQSEGFHDVLRHSPLPSVSWNEEGRRRRRGGGVGGRGRYIRAVSLTSSQPHSQLFDVVFITEGAPTEIALLTHCSCMGSNVHAQYVENVLCDVPHRLYT